MATSLIPQTILNPTLGSPVDPSVACKFIRAFYADRRAAGYSISFLQERQRIDQVLDQIEGTGTYRHTLAELTYGGREAWGQADRCVGRNFKQALEVHDRRSIGRADDVAHATVEHMRAAMRPEVGRKLPRSLLTVFEPVKPNEAGVVFLGNQSIQFAGYRNDGERVRGDAKNVAYTEEMIRRGMHSPGPDPNFDVLPFGVVGSDGSLAFAHMPVEDQHLVDIRSDDVPAINTLGLKWYAVPQIVNFRMEIGGLTYPIAFNGWYMHSEISMLDLLRENRYNLRGPLAEAMFGPDHERECRRDPRLRTARTYQLEAALDDAVISSFAKARVHLSVEADAHEQFARWVQHELRAGRPHPPVDPTYLHALSGSRVGQPTFEMLASEIQEGVPRLTECTMTWLDLNRQVEGISLDHQLERMSLGFEQVM